MSQINTSLASQFLQGLSQSQSSLGTTQQTSASNSGTSNPFSGDSVTLGQLVQLYQSLGGNVSSLDLPSSTLNQYLSIPPSTTTPLASSTTTTTTPSTTAATSASPSATIPEFQNLTSTQESQIESSSMYSTLQNDLQALGPSTTTGMAQASLTDSKGNPVLDSSGNPTYNNQAKVQYLNEYIASIEQGASGSQLTTGSQQEVTAAQNLITYLNSNQGNDQQVQNTMQVLSGKAQEQISNQSIFQNASNSYMGNDPDDDFQQVEDDLDKSTQAMNAAVNGLNDDDGGSGDD